MEGYWHNEVEKIPFLLEVRWFSGESKVKVLFNNEVGNWKAAHIIIIMHRVWKDKAEAISEQNEDCQSNQYAVAAF